MRRSFVLTGLMGAGKTTVGNLLAQRLGFTFVDLDAEIERLAKKSVAEIFAKDGEPAFRDLETQALRGLAARERIVVATGGGAPMRPENRELMHAIGDVVWLDVAPEIAHGRTKDSDRPLLKTADPLARLKALAVERQTAYADCDFCIDANLDPETCATRILEY